MFHLMFQRGRYGGLVLEKMWVQKLMEKVHFSLGQLLFIKSYHTIFTSSYQRQLKIK